MDKNGVDAFVLPKHQDVQGDAHASDEHHRKDDIQKEEQLRTSTRDIWNGNFFCVDVREEHLVMSIESWRTCILVVVVPYNGFLRILSV